MPVCLFPCTLQFICLILTAQHNNAAAYAMIMSVYRFVGRFSVHLSHSWVTPKLFKISKYALHHTIERYVWFLASTNIAVLNLGYYTERMR